MMTQSTSYPSLLTTLQKMSLLFAIFACLSLTRFASAQYRAGLQGTVTDPTGAVVPAASVTILDKETNQSQTVKTDGGGTYTFNRLAPASYAVSAEAKGFAKKTVDNVTISGETMQNLNVALEAEGAALAATRRNASQEAQIQESFFEFDRLLQLGKPTGQADFAFHRSIAEATNNPFYVEVLDALGGRTIPCDVTSPYATEEILSVSYQAGLQREHLAILNAISAGDATGARDAMRAHLSASQERYRERLRDRRTRYQSIVEAS